MKQLLKKSISSVLSIAVLLIAVAVPALADVTPTLTVGQVSAQPSETGVAVPVTLANLDDTAGYSGTITFDSALTVTGIEDNDGVFVLNDNIRINGQEVSFADVCNFDSTVTTLDFNVIVTAPAASGTYDIAVTGFFCNYDEEDLTVGCTAGSVTVAAAHVHDFSGDWQSDETYHWKECPADDTIGEQAAHTWNDGVVTTAATHTTDGVMTYTCTVCGATKTETIGATAHTYSEDWTYDEDNHWHACTANDGATDALAAHTFGDAVVVQPTTTAAGSSTRTCTVCGYQEVTTIPAAQELALSTGNMAPKQMYFDAYVGQRIRINYNASAKGVLQRDGAIYKDYDLVIDYQSYNGSYMLEDKQVVFASSDRDTSLSTAKVHYFTFTNPALYEMGLEFNVTLRLYDENGIFVAYQQETTSVAQTALTELQSMLSANRPAVVKALVDLVNFGAEAQTYFATGRSASDIASAALPTIGFEAYQSYASTESDLDGITFDTTSYRDAKTADNIQATNPTAKIEAALSIAYNYRKSNVYTADQLRVDTSYEGAYGTQVSSTEVATLDSTDTVYKYVFSGLKLYDMNKPVTFELKANGTTVYTVRYSAGAYLSSTVAASATHDFGVKLALFSESVRIALVGS